MSQAQEEQDNLNIILFYNQYFKRLGWLKSIADQKVIDVNGEPIPWFTYPAIDQLKSRVHKNLTVFEYGCGYGTLWWAKHVSKITIVEHNLEWYNKMIPQFPENVRYIHRKLDDTCNYARTIKDLLPIKFNIIVIDGRDRVNCCKNCLESLTDDGVIIFDNVDRERYKEGVEFIKSYGFRELRLSGLAPMVPVLENATSFFYKNNNCLGL